MHYVNIHTLITYQDKKVLYEFISKDPAFLYLFKDKEDALFHIKIKTIIKALKIKFEVLNEPDEEIKELFEYVYENNHYVINKHNILLMLKFWSKNFNTDNYNTKNYTAIKESGCTPLINYIAQYIEEYVKNVYLQIEENTQEQETYLLELLNHKDISESSKNSILKTTTSIIRDISKIDDEEFRLLILNSNKLDPTWENLFEIFNYQKEISKDIIEFINIEVNALTLSNINVPNVKDENGKLALFQMWKDILVSSELSLVSFYLILNSSRIKIRYFDFEHITQERLEIMIKQKKFEFSNRVYDELNTELKLNQKYLESYKDELLNFKDFKIQESHLTEILNSNAFTASEVNKILEVYDIEEWKSPSFLDSLKVYLSKNVHVNISAEKIIETVSIAPQDYYNVKILNNYFEAFVKSDIKAIINQLKDLEYSKYLSNKDKESLELSQTTYNNELFELMKKYNYIGEKSRKTKKGYLIYKNKGTVVF